VATIVFDQVTLALGGKTVLAGISLAINDGEFVGVLGGNGAGKTTLLRAVLGLVSPASGTIRVFDAPVKRGDGRIGYLPQSRIAAPPSRLTGCDFLASSVRASRWGIPLLSARDAAELAAVIDLVGGAEIAQRPIATLSGGERQRLLVAQALVGRPRLLLLDEPLIGLDPRQQQVVVDLVRRLASDLGLTVLFSAHELNQLLPAIDRVLYVGNGSAALGTVDEVVTPAVMSRLYGAPIEVVRAGGRIFILSEGREVEHHHHDHPHHDHHADAHARV
jgi:zinc/manganese transport system ATP-binding protein